jgi:hypothetical protein
MDNTRLIDLAMKAFALGLCEGHELSGAHSGGGPDHADGISRQMVRRWR